MAEPLTGREFSRVFVPTYNAIIGFFFLASTAAYFYKLHFVMKPKSGEKRPLLGGEAIAPATGVTRIYRRVRSVLLYQAPGRYLEANGTMFVVLSYLGLNAFYCFYGDSTHDVSYMGNRFGLVCVVNLPIMFLLGSKTGLLVQWTGWSHEGYNILHRHAGRVVCLTALGHIIAYSYNGRTLQEQLMRSAQIGVGGGLTGLAFTIILVTSFAPARNKMYEIFLYAHVWFLVAGIVLLFFHYPRCRPYCAAASVIWLWDRINRFKNAHHVVATTTVLSGNTVKLSMNVKSTFREIHWQTGQYVYVTINKLAPLQAHPFTIASPPNPNTLELIIRARQGFSKSLFLAEEQEHRVTFHGPYGSPPKFDGFSKVILLAGGAGVAYSYPEAVELTRQFPGMEVDFFWVVPQRDFISWVDMDPKFNVDFKVWVTAEQGRPDIEQYVKDSVAAAQGQKCAVAVCGPAPLVRNSRNACASLLWQGVDVEFYSENFGW
ncbi:FAD-binding domain-containing protein [Lipomyces doorenjongii]|uniref:FAD-binding domain-containing protein n=1 Tax=Lipomyces doorenjongii TaxID=383834 RepID=UPI0033440449